MHKILFTLDIVAFQRSILNRQEYGGGARGQRRGQQYLEPQIPTSSIV